MNGKHYRYAATLVCALSIAMLATPTDAAAQRGGHGSVHSAGRGGPGRSPGGHHSAARHRSHVHHVHHMHHAMHPWAFRGPSIWVWHPIGFLVTTIAVTAIVVSIVDDDGNTSSSGNVYYDQGVYYEKQSDGSYKAIPPPKGAQISSLPEGYTSVSVGSKQYGYYQGDFYVEGADGKYVVTAAPVGAIVPYIPDSATEKESDGKTTYEYNGVTYDAVSLNGDTSYVVSKSS